MIKRNELTQEKAIINSQNSKGNHGAFTYRKEKEKSFLKVKICLKK